MRILKGSANNTLVFSPDGRSLLGRQRIWDLATGEGRNLAKEHSAMGFTPDGASLFGFIGGYDRVPAIFPATGLGTWQARRVAGRRTGWYSRVVLSGAAGRLGQIDEDVIWWWSWPELERLPAWEGLDCRPRCAFTPDGEFVAIAQREALCLYEVALRKLVWRADGPKWIVDYAGPCFSIDGRWVAVATGRRLWAYDARTGEVAARLSLPQRYYQDIAFTADGRFLVGVSNEATVKVYETATWSLRHELAWEIGQLKSVAFSPDGMLGAAAGDKKQVIVWDVDW